MANIIIVTGTPGVGKTVLARLLARATGSHFLNVSELAIKEGLYWRLDRSTRSYVLDERRIHKRLKDYFAVHRRDDLVVETHFLEGIVPRRREMVAIVLRLDPIILARRLKARKWSRRKIWKNVESEIIDVSLYESVRFLGMKKVYELDATGKGPRLLMSEALKMMSKRRGLNRKTSNWLELYDPIDLSRKIL